MPWMATAKPPIQSSPVGIDEVGEAHVGPALALLHLLAEDRQAGLVIAGEHEDVVALAAAAPQADRAARRQPMLGDDLVEHRLRVGEQAAARSRRPPGRRGSRDNCRPAPRRGRTASSRCSSRRSRSGQSLKLVDARALRRRRLACGIVGEGVGARLRERGELALALAGAGLADLRHSRRAVRSISGSRCVSETRLEATPTARLASRTWITGPS